jgi:hypothetical protein
MLPATKVKFRKSGESVLHKLSSTSRVERRVNNKGERALELITVLTGDMISVVKATT